MSAIVRYVFNRTVDMAAVGDTLSLAVIAVESLHGESTVRLDAQFSVNSARRSCLIHADTEVGRALNRVFVGYAKREFGGGTFRVCRARPQHASAA